MSFPLQRRIVPSARAAVFAAGALLATVGILDWITGPRLDFSLFYLIPVCFVTWHTGRPTGYVVSAVSAGVWLIVDRLTRAEPSYPLVVPWNFAMRLTFFAGTVYLLNGWQRATTHLAATVDQRTAALRRMAAALSVAEEAERRRLAYDMHDAFSQTLSLIRMNLDAAQLESGDEASVRRRLADCATMVESVTRQARTLMFDLYPAMLDDLGLVPTLEWYARQVRDRAGTEVAVAERGARQPLPAEMTNYLFRATKELVNNAVRHGQAKEVGILLHWQADSLRLVVDDDGSGFDAARQPTGEGSTGLGLASIRERLMSMGGHMQAESLPGRGARVIIELPLRADASVVAGGHAAVVVEESDNAVASVAG